MKAASLKAGATYRGEGGTRRIVSIADGWVYFHYGHGTQSDSDRPASVRVKNFISWAREEIRAVPSISDEIQTAIVRMVEEAARMRAHIGLAPRHVQTDVFRIKGEAWSRAVQILLETAKQPEAGLVAEQMIEAAVPGAIQRIQEETRRILEG